MGARGASGFCDSRRGNAKCAETAMITVVFLLCPVAMMRQFLDVVNQAIQVPLRVDLRS